MISPTAYTQMISYGAAVGISRITKANAAEFYARVTLYAKAHGGTALEIDDIRKHLDLNVEAALASFTPMSRMQFRKAMKDSDHPVQVQELERLKAVFEAAAPEACRT